MSACAHSPKGVLLFATLMQLAPAGAGAAPPTCKYCPDESGWSGSVEGGIGDQSDDAFRFGRYTGYTDEGTLLNADGEFRFRGEEGGFLEGRAQELSLDSRRVWLEGGRQGTYEIGLEYHRIPNFRDESARTPFRDMGGGELTLPAQWVPGQTTAAMPTLGAHLSGTALKSERDRTGARFTFVPKEKWEVSGYIRREQKRGVKDVGATFGFTQAAILPVPFEYQTNDFGLALGFSGERFQSRLAYAGSHFRNDRNALLWRNPYEDLAANAAQGQMAEAPDNQFHQISALLGYQLGDKTRISARLAVGRMTQDETFLPYTINPALATTPLPATNLNGEVNTTLAALGIHSRPTPRLRLDANYTYSDRDNDSSVNVYDYVVTDLGGGGVRRNRPYGFEQRMLQLKAGYRLAGGTDLALGFDDDRMDRTLVQVEETRDRTLWTKLKLRASDKVETTLRYAYSERDASAFVPLADIDPLLDNANPGFHDNPLMRAHHLADRTRRKAGVELAFTPTEALSLSVEADHVEDDYREMVLGLQEASGLIYSASLSYAFSDTLVASAFYTYDRLRSEQQGSERSLPGDSDAFWVASDRYLTETVGLGLVWEAMPGKLDLGADLTYAEFNGTIDLTAAPPLPELSSTLTAAALHGTYRLTDNLSVRAGYRYEEYEEQDWTRDGTVDTLPTVLSLGTAPQDYTVHLVLLSLRYHFR